VVLYTEQHPYVAKVLRDEIFGRHWIQGPATTRQNTTGTKGIADRVRLAIPQPTEWQRIVGPLTPSRARVREALVETSLAGVTQLLSGPAGLGDHGKPRVSQLQSRCSQAAKYAP